MTISSKHQRWRVFDGESEQGFRQFKDRVYGAGQMATLADADFGAQEGDPLPDDSTYEIIASTIKRVRPLTGKDAHKGGRAIVLRAVKFKVEGASQSPWQELSGARNVSDTDPQTIQYRISFLANTGTALPSAGDTISDVIGSGSLSSTGLDREPVVVHIGARIKATVLRDIVTLVFQAHHARTTTGSSSTEINPRQRTLVGRNSWRGRRRFSVPLASAVNLESSLFGSVFPGLSGKYAAICNRVETQDNWEPGRSLVIADYETPRVLGEGRLRIEIGGTRELATTNLAGDIIIGPEYLDAKRGMAEHKLVSGQAFRLRPNAIIILETAATAFNVNIFLDRVGQVNKFTLPNFGNAKPGTLLFLGAPNTTYRLVGDLWYLNLAFQYSSKPKWNEMTKTQLGSFVAQEMPGLTIAGTVVTGIKKYQSIWVPKVKKTDSDALGIKQEPKTQVMFKEGDFRDFGRDLIITGI